MATRETVAGAFRTEAGLIGSGLETGRASQARSAAAATSTADFSRGLEHLISGGQDTKIRER